MLRAVAGPSPVSEKFLPFFLFMLAGSITPGPNTMISTASGAAFGFARTMPQMTGVAVGFALMIAALGFGIGEIFRRVPLLHEVLRYAGAAFLLYLAWRVAQAAGPERGEAKRPLTFVEAALFQWLNPKAWTLALGTIAAFTTPGLPFNGFLVEIGIISAVSAATAFGSLLIWCLFGVMIASALADQRKRRVFQYSLAALLAASIGFLFV